MRKSLVLFTVILLVLSGNGLFAQLSENPLYKNVDFSKISPDQIPAEDELKKLGATPEEIKSIMEYKNKTSAPSATTESTTIIPTQKTEIETVPVMQQQAVQLNENEQSVPIKIYGQDFFRNRNMKFYEKASDAKASDNYILAGGDEISISVWGYSSYNEIFKLESDGSIKPTETGRIYLKGLKFNDAKALIINRFGQVFDLGNSKIDITLVYSRVINVNIVGEVVNPGSYSISAINTAFNALVAASGTTEIGSVRKIYVKRAGKTIKTLDVYQYLLNPDSNEDFYLEDNDYIFVPLVEKIVAVSGGIKRPHNYELIENEDLETLIQYAGGLSSSAYSQSVQIKRIENNRTFITDVNLDSLITNKKNFELHDGDLVSVKTISGKEENFVDVDGEVRIPGRYELKKADKIYDLIMKAEGVLNETYLERAYLIRQKNDLSKEYISINLGNILKDQNSPENLFLQKYDLLSVFSKSRFIDYDSISVTGFVRVPQNYLYGAGMTIKDAIYLAGGFKTEAANNRIEVSRVTNLVDTSKRVIILQAEIEKDLSLPDKVSDFKLQPYDIIFVRKIAQFSYQENVVIEGEVNYPGVYTIKENERLTDLIERAGGLTPFAFLEGAKLQRSEKNIGYVLLDLKKVMKRSTSNFNYLLKSGDNIFIPKTNELVAIKGAINYPDINRINQISAPLFKHKRAGFYINQYGGGFAKKAAKGKTYVMEPNGFVKTTFNLAFIHVYPKVKIGSVIYTQYKEEKEKSKKKEKEPLDWNKVIENTTVKITGVLTLWILINQVVAN
jgi:protein involved in polysaccharide export with SLBB domain